MHLASLLGFAAAFASVTFATEAEQPPQPSTNLQHDETSDWYKSHGMPVPEVAAEITTIEANKSYVVRLECPDCPFLMQGEGKQPVWQKQDNTLLLNFTIHPSTVPTLHLNGASILPLGPMPLYISALQVASNISRTSLSSIIASSLISGAPTSPSTNPTPLPLQYEHSLLKTRVPGQWYLQFDVLGLAIGPTDTPLLFDIDRRIVQLLVKEEKLQTADNADGNIRSLTIEDIRLVERYLRAAPPKMKCGKPAAIVTSFDPREWDEFGKLGSWAHAFGKVWGGVEEKVVRNALLLPCVLLLALVVFLARVWVVSGRREGAGGRDAEYALVGQGEDEDEAFLLPPAYGIVPVIKVEEYD